jgi:hypothetical protein
MSSSVQRMVRTEHHETTRELAELLGFKAWMQNRMNLRVPRIPTLRSLLSSREMTSIQRDVRTKPLSKPGASERGRRRLKLCAPYFLGHQVDGSEDNLYTAIATVWQLLAIDKPRIAARAALQHFVQSLLCRPLAVILGGHKRNIVSCLMVVSKETT